MDTNKIIEYIMTTPHNTNWAVLSSMLDDGDWEELRKYVMNTSGNMNKRVLESFVGKPISAPLITVINGVYTFEKTTDLPGVVVTYIEMNEIFSEKEFIYFSLDNEDFITIDRFYGVDNENIIFYSTASSTEGFAEGISVEIMKDTNEAIIILSENIIEEGEHSIIIQQKSDGNYKPPIPPLDPTEKPIEEPTEEPTLQMLGQLDLLMGTEDSSNLPTKKYTVSVPAENVINEELTGAFWYNGQADAKVQHHAYSLNNISFGGLNISKNLESNVLTIEFYYYTDDISIETALLKWYNVIEDGQEVGKTWKVFVNGEEPREMEIGV